MSHFTSKMDIFMFECHGRSQSKQLGNTFLSCVSTCALLVLCCVDPRPRRPVIVLHSEACLGRRRRCSKMCPHAMVNYVTKIFGT